MSRGLGAALGAAAMTLLLALPAGAPAQGARPDLVVDTLGNPPTTVEAGKAFSVPSAVTNRGRARAGKSTVLFFLSKNAKHDKSDVELSGRRSVAALARRKRSLTSKALRVPASMPAGSYRLIACADGLKKVRESKENNNCRTARRAVAVVSNDRTPPPAPVLGATDPPSPSRSSTAPTVRGAAEPGSTVSIFTGLGCTGAPVAQGAAGAGGAVAIAVSVATFFATARDAAGNVSVCSLQGLTFVHDAIAPSVALTATDPASPSSNGTPTVRGTSESGATVRVFLTAGCSGEPAGTAIAGGDGAFAIPASVEPDTTNALRAHGTDAAGNQSPCSAPISYREDSTAPRLVQADDPARFAAVGAPGGHQPGGSPDVHLHRRPRGDSAAARRDGGRDHRLRLEHRDQHLRPD